MELKGHLSRYLMIRCKIGINMTVEEKNLN